jgi:hypothetical protein
MCDAATVGKAGLGLQAFGAASSAVGSYNKAKSDKYALDYQAKVAENNAIIAGWKASDAITRGQTDVARQQLKTRQLKGAQRASLAARGVDLGEGSALNILTDTDFMGAIDANQITDNAAKEAWAYRQEASNYSSNAELISSQSKSINPLGSGFSTLLSGAGNVASSWYNLKSKTG